MKKIAHIVVALAMVIPATAEFRNWTDRNGNSMEAEFIRKSGKEVILRDRNGRNHWIDPEKLSDEDRLYLNPPPPEPQKYELSLHRYAQQKIVDKDKDADTTTVVMTYDCSIKIKFLTDDATVEGLKGALFILGQDEEKNFVVLNKFEAPVEKVGNKEGRVEGAGFSTTFTKDEDHNLVQGVQYYGHLMVLYANDGTVLVKKQVRRFLEDHEKAFSLNIGDWFNEQLDKIEQGN